MLEWPHKTEDLKGWKLESQLKFDIPPNSYKQTYNTKLTITQKRGVWDKR